MKARSTAIPPPGFRFRWEVPDGGFQWDETARVQRIPQSKGGDDPPFLITARRRNRFRAYRPLEEVPDLYLKLAQLYNAEDLRTAIVDLANRYGPLGIEVPLYNPDLAKQESFHGEPLRVWGDEIGTLRTILNIWKWAQQGGENKLGRYIVWTDQHQSVTLVLNLVRAEVSEKVRRQLLQLMNKRLSPSPPLLDEHVVPSFRHLAGAARPYPHVFRTWKTGSMIEPARFAVCQIVNEKLRGNASPQLLIQEDGTAKPHAVPHNLLAAIWVQMRDVISGKKRFIECEVCGGEIDVTDGRSSKRMHTSCSQRERIRRFRQKQKREGEKRDGKKARSK